MNTGLGTAALRPAGTGSRLAPTEARLRAFLAVVHSLVAAEDEHQLLACIADAACRTLGYDSCLVSLDDGSGNYRLRASYGASQQTLTALEALPMSREVLQQLRQRAVTIGTLSYLAAEAVTGLPAELGSQLLRSGAPLPPESPPAAAQSRRASTGLILVPLVDREASVIGYLNPDRSTAQPPPTTEEALMLETLAQLAVVALDTARSRAAERRQRELAESRQRQLEALLRASATIRSTLRLDDVLTEIAAAMTGPGGFRRIAIYLLDPATGELHARASAGLAVEEASRLSATPVPRAQFDPLTRPEMRISRSYLFDHRRHQLPAELLSLLSVVPEGSGWADGLWHPLDSLTVPLLDADGAEIGLLSVDEPVDRQFPNRSHIAALEFFADQCATAVRQADHYRAVETRARTDTLTGLANRGAADEHLDQLLRRTQQDARICVLFCDLDHFKVINDRHGHAIGDQILRDVAGILTRAVRSNDLVARYGGEEFLIILTDIGRSAAAAVAEAIRTAVAAAVLGTESAVRTTISIGVASTPTTGREVLIKAADQALYLAKQAGRNQVRLAL